MTADPSSIATTYEDLIRKSIGAADEVLRPDPELSAPDVPEINVYVFRARSVRYSLLVTGGASSKPMPGAKDDWAYPKRFELYCKLSAKIIEPAHINGVATRLWMAAQLPFRGKRRPLGHWQLCGGLPPFADGSELTAWLFTPPLTEDKPVKDYQFAISEAVGTTALVQAIGITEAERAIGEQFARRDRKLDDFAEALFKRSGAHTHTNRTSADMTDLIHPVPTN